MGVDFAANASSKAIKESVVLSAAPDDANPTYSIAINSSNQYEYTFAAKGSIQSITLPAGRFKLEVWGAQGGQRNVGNPPGGYGGYSYAEVEFASATTVYVAVGGVGATGTNSPTSMKGGGWNGGGNTASTAGAGGGGATHMATAQRGDGQLKNYESNKNDLLLVAGGGGGSGHDSNGRDITLSYGKGGGGYGGGQSGQNQESSSYTYACRGLGGTLSAGGGHSSLTGANGHTSTSYAGGDTNTNGQSVTNGSFGQGGNGTSPGNAGGGGGGGYFGGGGGVVNGGGGGSGYINTSRVIANTYGGSKTNEATREGDGLAKITDLTKCATQSSIPTYTLTRHDTKTLTFAGTNSDNSLLGVDPSNLALSAHTNYIYQVNGIANTATQETLRARTWTDAEKADAAANSWLTYSFTSNGVTLKAMRYWTGTKAFFVRVKNTHGSPSWFRFNASVEGGELKKDTTPTGDFKFGKSTTQVPKKRREISPLRSLRSLRSK